ncbi:MAG TPA: glutaredoxin domain-containing protein, partial [Rhodanobacteraceae bacterium]|nr:glutaredoxin domain-containing protein [Rhodanobacteraceae bacterium]
MRPSSSSASTRRRARRPASTSCSGPERRSGSMGVTLYGLNTCDTCKKARSWLARHKIAHDFVDYRENPIPPAKLKDYANAVGGW